MSVNIRAVESVRKIATPTPFFKMFNHDSDSSTPVKCSKTADFVFNFWLITFKFNITIFLSPFKIHETDIKLNNFNKLRQIRKKLTLLRCSATK